MIKIKGRLRRCFPGPAVVIGQDRIADSSFFKPLVELLARFTAKIPEEVLSIATKAHSKVIETRDTVHPKFVIKILTGILRAVRQPHPENMVTNILNVVGGVPKGMEHGMFFFFR